MRHMTLIVSAMVLVGCSENDTDGCPARPLAELTTVSEAAFSRFNNDKMFTSPVDQLTPRASGFSYQANIPGWFGVLEVTDQAGTIVASLFAMVPCNGGVEFAVEWKRQADGTVKSGLSKE
ncbi:hypothetical protein GV67_21790 [Pseudorhizobium pelagicum]|uniref:Lipoprotein n=2 Tax=Pseudorhizobium pelagicum TaxID=1509405 RepID=A0A922NYS0_9HYPH|nr:hypothetical protein GV68_12575 [Pseudorhizobium pelagicum]KEQ07407.1 hypothetical protein GV67_21790 [Pseudorhizobium pelagicum]